MVAAALRRRDGRVLMHRRPAHKQHGGLWEFPGGKVEPGEAPGQALVREIEEELGIAVDPAAIRPLAFAEEPPSGLRRGTVILLYTIATWRGEPTALDEGATIDWFLPPQIAGLPSPPLDRALWAQIGAGGALPAWAG